MIRTLFLVFLAFGIQGLVLAQTPQVPSEMQFADMQLKITEGARKEIQSHVDALYRSEKYFTIKLERVDLYFPLIEKIFREENLPDDFKYLVIQESALISDAVSSSNAVGFWQFKKASGEEVGLRIDGAVDERMNIISSSRGAARYLKRNNNYFGNWLYALLSYNTGAGGAQKIVDDKYFGAKKMEIDKRTHWYIIKFLAHKVAFENAIGKNAAPPMVLVDYTTGANKTLRQIASETRADHQLLEDYNKWLKRGSVPNDKVYSVIIPSPYADVGNLVAKDYDNGSQAEPTATADEKPKVSLNSRFSKGSDKYPVIEGEVPAVLREAVLIKVNGRPGIIAGPNDNLLNLAEAGDVAISRFLKFNDLNSTNRAVPGQVYYLKSKRGRAAEHYHVVTESDNLWTISQKYGIKLKKILQKNRMEKGEQLKPGRVLWLRFVRPKDEPVEYQSVPENSTIASGQAQRTNIDLEEKEVSKKLPPRGEVRKQEPVNAGQTEAREAVNVNAKVPETAPETQTELPYLGEENLSEEELTDQEPVYAESEEDPGAFSSEGDIRFVETEDRELKASATTAEEKNTHTVKQGETLYSIARKYNIQLGEVLLWNDLSLRDEIKVDQILRISPPEEKAAAVPENPVIKGEEFIIHEVTSGETMYKIARDHNVTIKDVMQWNNKSDFGVSIGEKLKIKKPVN